MAAGCYGARRLSDLLQEHQEEEPFLEAPQHRSAVEACARRLRQLGCAAGGYTLLWGGYRTARKALRRGGLAGCFICGARQRFRRLPRAGVIGDRCDVVSELDGGDGDCGRQLSPVSVLELHSDEESPVLSNWDEEDDDDGKPSSSPPSDHDLSGTATPPCSAFFVTDGKIRPMEVQVQHSSNRLLQRKSGGYSLAEKEHHQAIVSDWERIATDISRIPALVALDLSGSAREWRRLVGEEEARRVGQSIEAIIFEEVRWEAVRDMMMLCSARVNSD